MKDGRGMRRLIMWTRAWIELADAIICIVTFTGYCSYWSFKFFAWENKRELRRKMEETK